MGLKLCSLFFVVFLASFVFARPKFPAGPFEASFGQVSQLPPPPAYKTLYFDQYLDHFNYGVTSQPGQSTTFKQRYLYADTYWGKPINNGDPFPLSKRKPETASCPGPIFFYTGNESPVTDYYAASGLFTQVIAPQFGGLLVFAEHRYFGDSMPFGAQSFDLDKIVWDSTDQALADYARLITYLKNTLPNASNCPVFAFGGSYGGMLTTWFRMKYSNIVMGGLAASAPFAFLGTNVPFDAFTVAASNTFKQAGPNCDVILQNLINNAYAVINTAAGRAKLQQGFKLCGNGPLSYDDAVNVLEWGISGLLDMCMLDYPYPTNYGIPLPGWPVNVSCSLMNQYYLSDPIVALAQGVGVFYNGTGTETCFNITTDIPDFGGCCGWDYLACTEVYLPFASGGIFPPSPYNMSADIAGCADQFNIQLKPDWPYIHWGGFDLEAASNIIFSNGLLDPWHTSGILQNISSSLIAIVIPAAAHHLDLRAPNIADPPYVALARIQEQTIIYQWLSDYFNKKEKNSA